MNTATTESLPANPLASSTATKRAKAQPLIYKDTYERHLDFFSITIESILAKEVDLVIGIAMEYAEGFKQPKSQEMIEYTTPKLRMDIQRKNPSLEGNNLEACAFLFKTSIQYALSQNGNGFVNFILNSASPVEEKSRDRGGIDRRPVTESDQFAAAFAAANASQMGCSLVPFSNARPEEKKSDARHIPGYQQYSLYAQASTGTTASYTRAPTVSSSSSSSVSTPTVNTSLDESPSAPQLSPKRHS